MEKHGTHTQINAIVQLAQPGTESLVSLALEEKFTATLVTHASVQPVKHLMDIFAQLLVQQVKSIMILLNLVLVQQVKIGTEIYVFIASEVKFGTLPVKYVPAQPVLYGMDIHAITHAMVEELLIQPTINASVQVETGTVFLVLTVLALKFGAHQLNHVSAQPETGME